MERQTSVIVLKHYLLYTYTRIVFLLYSSLMISHKKKTQFFMFKACLKTGQPVFLKKLNL